MKRANTIDIPHPPGLILHASNNDDDTGMEDEEDSDSNYHVMTTHHGSATQTNKYPPFMPKTEGDRKFLAFLEKNNGLDDSGRPLRTSQLGVHDRQWTSRFTNLKTSFESSSQGSSPSASPVPSPLRPPRSVSEMALTQEKRAASSSVDNFSRPVWANTDKSQLPPQVRNKLHMFENKSVDGPPDFPQWRSPPPTAPGWHHVGQNSQFGGSRTHMQPGMKQTVSTSTLNQMHGPPPNRGYNRPVYSSHDNVALVGPKKILFQGNSFDSKVRDQHQDHQSPVVVRRPTPVKMQPGTDPLQSKNTSHGGVHMVHATAAAMEAMKKSAFVPTTTAAAVVPNVSSPTLPFTTKGNYDDRVDLPWARRGQDESAGRVQTSKARFEQPQPVPMIPQHIPLTSAYPQFAPPLPQNNVAAPQHYPQRLQQQQQKQEQQQPLPRPSESSPDSPVIKCPTEISPTSGLFRASPSIAGGSPHANPATTAISQQQQPPQSIVEAGSGDEFVPHVRPTLKNFGVTQSLDEAFQRKLEQQVSSGAVMYPDDISSKAQDPFLLSEECGVQSHQLASEVSGDPQGVPGLHSSISGTKAAFDRSSGSAFVRQLSPSPPVPPEEPNQDTKPEPSEPNNNDATIITPEVAVAKVMRGPQQQRATTATNRVSSLTEDEHNTRLTSARSNLRNFINQYQASSLSTESTKQPASPTQHKSQQGSLLNLPSLQALTKSSSGDVITSSPPKPAPLPTTNFRQLEEGKQSSQEQLESNKTVASSDLLSRVHAKHHAEFPQQQQQQQKRPVAIPRQKSLSEFPKLAHAPKIEPLTIETDSSRMTSSSANRMSVPASQQQLPQHQSRSSQPQQPFHQIHQQNRTTVTPMQRQHQHQQRNVLHQSQPARNEQHQPAQNHNMTMTNLQMLHQQQQQLLQQQQQQQSATSKSTRSYPDSLQRTSSGSSIFSRAKSLFFGSQDGVPPSTKLRPKLPSQPKITFPKQFEAQMSPDSADRKQRELATYFKQQHEQFLQQQQQGGGISGMSGGKLRKSASHSKIMHRQRSLSDGDEDVDAIFESLFKASGTPKK